MSGAQLGLGLVIAVPVAVIVVMIWWPNTDQSPPPARSSHRPPPGGLNVEQAHREMQRHRECSVIDCPAKETAQAVLIEAGHMVPDPRRGY